VMASECACPKDHESHCCCCQGDDKFWYAMTVIDYRNSQEWHEAVNKRGGDYALLASKRFSFTTHSLKTDQEAKDYVKQHGHELGLGDVVAHDRYSQVEAIVCIGFFELKWNKKKPCDNEERHEDDGANVCANKRS